MLELAPIVAALAAIDAGFKTVKSGTQTIKTLNDLLRNKPNPDDVDVTALKELIQDLRDENIGHREALLEARERLLELKQSVETEVAEKSRKALYGVVNLSSGTSILKLKDPDQQGLNPDLVCYVCHEKQGHYMPLERDGSAYLCRNCGRWFDSQPSQRQTGTSDWDPFEGY